MIAILISLTLSWVPIPAEQADLVRATYGQILPRGPVALGQLDAPAATGAATVQVDAAETTVPCPSEEDPTAVCAWPVVLFWRDVRAVRVNGAQDECESPATEAGGWRWVP